ncbi:hypothetical protein INT47_010686 [Mucor saturninus]|uniref:3'-5' exonuclease domain-containing protein n=1 Tax=Mucor saturninus TaxID=64648 RepID=A0A8H7UW02_9FUNG|nr:hypothetical protein INT47_010686 [Mucor saturninus]
MKESEVIYIDNVIGDQGFLKKVMPSLPKDVVPIPKCTNDQQQQRVLRSEVGINEACIEIFGNTDEYNVLPRYIVLFRVHDFDPNKFPRELSEVLNCSKIVKLGRNIKADCTRVKRVFGVVEANHIDFGPFCYNRDLVNNSRPRLDVLCGSILSLQLTKISIIRRGDWERDYLTSEQIRYAALDAWVALKIFEKANGGLAVNEKVTKKPQKGTFVAVYNQTSARVMPSAYGFIEDNEGSIEAHLKDARLIKVDDILY